MQNRATPPAVPVLTALVPPGAVPAHLRQAVSGVLGRWGYGWDELALVGTATLRGARLDVAAEVWVFAVAAGPLAVGDELAVSAGRVAGLGVSAFRGGVIPVTPYRAQVYESLGRRGGGGRRPPEDPRGPAALARGGAGQPDGCAATAVPARGVQVR